MIRYRCIAGFDGMEANRDGIYVRIDDHELVAKDAELATLRARVEELEEDRERFEWWCSMMRVGLGNHPIDVEPTSLCMSAVFLNHYPAGDSNRAFRETRSERWRADQFRDAIDAARASARERGE